MISIFHGADPAKSRDNLYQAMSLLKEHSILKLEGKNITLESVNNFLNSTSLFTNEKALILLEYFQLSPPVLNSVNSILVKSTHPIFIYASNSLTSTQLKPFLKAKIVRSTLNSNLYLMLSSLKPHNSSSFFTQLNKTLETEPPELVDFMIRRKLRELITRPNGFNSLSIINTYLSLIDIDYLIKSGQNPLSLSTLLSQALLKLF